ncbi:MULTISPECIES: CsiV family protein [unclassified Pseudomonas]|uniref:CsiV family protein n=1 Tax=unclassified Pseudomonas TaxID=196821 RepID=UPI002AC907AD|nr:MULTISPECIES: CsiV family protein [unclassified Pseudomonas]MEB0046287.1 CsiV family protein [Pseudomonas sp. Dout3]MEB0097547.1 CsiV family protein [Pseudomonas sp. DC1.2]WPX60835.1 CsiV family protein [Pseudomonas sp. DC1.2]
MRLFCSLTLLLTLVAPSAFADDKYQVEMILVRQNAVPAIVSRAAPEDWAAGAQRIKPDDLRTPSLSGEVEKLTANADYTVLLHKAWQQNLGEAASKIAISDGAEQFGQFPIEGTLNLTLGRFTDVDADFWVNQIDANGLVTASERLKQESHTKNGQLNFLDNGHLGLLIKITSLTAPAPRPTPEEIPD